MEVIGMAMFASTFGPRYDDTSAIRREFKELLPSEIVHQVCGIQIGGSSAYDKPGLKKRMDKK